MLTFLLAVLAYVSALVSSRQRLALEAVALRQQLAVYKRKQPLCVAKTAVRSQNPLRALNQ